MSVPTFRAVGTGSTSGGSSVAVTVPAATQVGDLLLLTIGSIGGAATTPTGWTHIRTDGLPFPGAGAPYCNIHSWWKLAEVGDPGSTVTVNFSGGTSAFYGAVTAWDGGLGIAASAGVAYSTATGASTIDSPTVAAGAAAVYRTVTVFAVAASGSFTPPGSSTERVDGRASYGYYISLAVNDDTADPAVARTETFSSSSSRRVAQTIVLRGGSVVRVWNGSAWVEKPLYRWNGTAWEAAVLKRWNGTAWEAV